MHNPLKICDFRGPNDEQKWQSERIEDYLDHLCGPLIGVLPYRRRQEVRLEAEGHLYELIHEHRAAGLEVRTAMETALRQYGPPHRLGLAIVDSWCAGEGSGTRPTRYMRMAAMRSFACFSTPVALSLLLIENYALTGAGTQRPAWILIWLLVSPLLAGGLSGWIIPTRSARAVCSANACLLLYGVVIGLLLLPVTDGLYLAAFELIYGLPAGALTAHLFESLRRHLRRTTYRASATR